jgi:hypothetical protein
LHHGSATSFFHGMDCVALGGGLLNAAPF